MVNKDRPPYFQRDCIRIIQLRLDEGNLEGAWHMFFWCLGSTLRWDSLAGERAEYEKTRVDRWLVKYKKSNVYMWLD